MTRLDSILRWIARLLVRGPNAPFILGDLDEELRRDLDSGRRPWSARGRFLGNAVGSSAALARGCIARVTRRIPVSVLDVKLAGRMLTKHPGLTAVAVFALALGIPASLYPVHLVIRGGDDAIHVADRLVAENAPVILTSTMDAPGRDYEGYDGAYRRADDLHEAGVKIAISGGSSALYTDRLPYEAGVAVAFGLPEEEAVKAVTINAAEMLGLDDRIGSLETGKQATLLITTGNPLDTMADIEQAYIQGRELDMNDIQKHFFEKYMTKLRQRTQVIF